MIILFSYNLSMDHKYTLSEKVGKRIREIRISKNIRQCELAEKIDIEPTNLSKIENGVYLPREDKLNKIIEVLGVELKDLFDVDHILPRQEILKKIDTILKKLNENELSYFYKLLKSYIEMPKH